MRCYCYNLWPFSHTSQLPGLGATTQLSPPMLNLERPKQAGHTLLHAPEAVNTNTQASSSARITANLKTHSSRSLSAAKHHISSTAAAANTCYSHTSVDFHHCRPCGLC